LIGSYVVKKVVVFGGTGFLGRRVVRHLLDHAFVVRVASRHPERAKSIFSTDPSMLELVRADIAEVASIHEAVRDAFAAVNAVSLYVERGNQTFHSVHVDAAERLARHAREAGVTRLVHVSGIGADPASPSPYIRSRGEGEHAVRAAFPEAAIIRSAVMFGPDDAFLASLTVLLRKLPLFALFGGGGTRLQPAHVEDIGEAIARIIDGPQAHALYELAGPRIYTYKELLESIGNHLGLRRTFFPVPFWIWQALAYLVEFLPRPPFTRSQVELMRVDNVASTEYPGFGALGIQASGIEAVLPTQ
jgi:uncharacterized protein YbjT (DUF2867 family)